jgi:phenylacetate-CoA ligase
MFEPLDALIRMAGLASYWLGKNWSREEIARYRDKRIKALVERAARESPFYQRIWREAGVDPQTVRGADGLARLPVTTKSQMKAADAELPPAGVDRSKLVKVKTNGSTGHPMEIRRTKAEDLLLRAFRVKEQFDRGMGWTDTRASLKTSTRGLPTARGQRRNPWWFQRGLLQFYSVDLTEGVETAISRIEEMRPEIVGGHADMIWRMSLELPEERLRRLGLKFITMSVQTVTDSMHRQVARAFGVPVYTTYGSTEFNLLAFECRETGLVHLNELCSYVEVLVDGRPAEDGESGEVYATNLHSETVPFIRFALGDWATMGPEACPCGAQVRTLRAVQGRVVEMMRLPGGRTIHPFELANPLQEFTHWLAEFRVIQEREDLIRIPFTLIRGAEAPAGASSMVQAVVRMAAGPDVRVEAEQVAALEPFTKGKNRLFESRLAV